ncbi:MAG TPA: tol-pal system protein YbgF [Candidatus Dormibacteraeota bacterium]|nr:tol-pal system protein YbgF [Candidatus Dormibacteraeota bacterium]
MTRRPFFLLFAFLIAATGCAPSGYYRSTSSSLDSLLTLQAQQQRRIAALEAEIAATREQVQSSRASSDSRLSELNGRMDQLQGKLEESGVRFTKLATQIESVKQRAAADTSRAPGAVILDPDEAFRAAQSDYAAGRYELARTSLTEYLKRFPDSEVSDDAQYLVGESAYNTGDFRGAIEAYRKVVENYPKGDHVPKALLKAGMASARINDVPASRRYYQLVIQRYPKSDEARLARERLSVKNAQ